MIMMKAPRLFYKHSRCAAMNDAKKQPSLSSLQEVMEAIMKERPSSPFQNLYFLCALRRQWPSLAGAEIAAAAAPRGFKNHELTLGAESSAQLHDLHFVKEALRRKINRKFPRAEVKKIHLRVNL